MSAFVCGPDHIRQIAIFAALPPTRGIRREYNVDPRFVPDSGRFYKAETHELASHYAEILYQENVRSVLHRYPADNRSDYLLRCRVTRQHVNQHQPSTSVEIIKLCACLDYQSCETDDYRTTLAHDLLEQIKQAAIYELPGYEDAPWTYEPRNRSQAA